MTAFHILTILSLGLLIGVELAVSIFINPVVARLDQRTRSQTVQMFAARLGRAMPFWYSINLVLLITEAILHRNQQGLTLLIAAACIWAVAILLSIIFLVPINNRMMQLDGTTFSEEAQREHNRWTTLHHTRVLTLIAAMICFLVALHI